MQRRGLGVGNGSKGWVRRLVLVLVVVVVVVAVTEPVGGLGCDVAGRVLADPVLGQASGRAAGSVGEDCGADERRLLLLVGGCCCRALVLFPRRGPLFVVSVEQTRRRAEEGRVDVESME